MRRVVGCGLGVVRSLSARQTSNPRPTTSNLRQPRRQPRRVDDHINFLRPLYLKHLRHGPASLGRGFPMDLVIAVAMNVVAQLLEIAALADLALRVCAEAAAIEKQSGNALPFGKQVRINAKLRIRRKPGAHRPEPPRRRGLDMETFQRIISAFQRGARPGEARALAARRQYGPHVLVRRIDLAWQRQSESQSLRLLLFVLDADFDGALAVFRQPYDGGQFNADSVQAALRQRRVQNCQHDNGRDE